MKKFFSQGVIVLAVFGVASVSYADENLNKVTAPTLQTNKKTMTMVYVGNSTTPAKVTLDTGSSMLVLEKQYLSNARADLSGKTVSMGYGNGAMMVHGQIVYTDVTLNTTPKITAVNVPVLMVPDGTFSDRAGIMGVEMNNQTSVWRHLPAPYNEMMVVNGPDSTVSFGELSRDEVNQFAVYQLNEGRCNNTVQPEAAYAGIACWATRKIPVTYTFKSADGEVVFDAQYNTVFDTGGVLTHFYLQPVPDAVAELTQGQTFNGKLGMRLESNNAGVINLPATDNIKVFVSKRNEVNSGYRIFYEKTVLFDARDGVVGFK
ncbi:MAG TPA: hypothetical protein VFU82_03625 [Gammaproteobacteria bacterium]|nr:hypothetical protein [Gammaproteobacteria bacterium]